jgi:methyl-accepting chemotaxis protein
MDQMLASMDQMLASMDQMLASMDQMLQLTSTAAKHATKHSVLIKR